jgi:hypothetical protein
MDGRLGQSRNIGDDELAACRALVSAIDNAARRSGAYEIECRWTNPDGALVYDSAALGPASITAEYIADLPRQSFFFTGWVSRAGATELGAVPRLLWRLLALKSPVLATKAFIWLANRAHVAALAPARDGPPLEVVGALFEHYARGLPSEYICAENFDGTEFDRLAVQERMNILHRSGLLEGLRSKPRPVILEIGAGYGALASAIKRVVPQAAYIIVDLPHSLYASACYLATRQAFPVAIMGEAMPSIPVGSFLLVVNTLAEKISGLAIDLAVNTLSFSEMPESAVDGYARLIRRHLSPDGALFEQNFDNKGVRRHNFCDSAAVLARHFPRCTEIKGSYLKGQPRVWRR